VAQASCLSSTDQAQRYQLLSFAISTLKANPGAKVYLDAGNPSWVAASDMAGRLKQAGIANADGFSLNVSNFIATKDNETYGAQLSALVGGKHFVIDTSRNGNGSNGQWCNPSGRALGAAPTASTGASLVDYFLWVKTPGESDGTCNGGPAAGSWWPSYAESLALNADW
ncbi:MAG TPA: glycoside hydrolase family 6 protein, partial [Candidatus Saccharimonadales bacterium]|nr:glycoside hydrolase family 6 protein [Candidatus Saccharimonadales bacterium]